MVHGRRVGKTQPQLVKAPSKLLMGIGMFLSRSLYVRPPSQHHEQLRKREANEKRDEDNFEALMIPP